MSYDIARKGRRHLEEIGKINRDLTEKALRMRAESYHAAIKAQLLTQTIYEVDKSKKKILFANRELQRMQKHLIRSEKLSSIGVLAAGVAHEILNPLNIVSVLAQSSLGEDLPDKTRECFKEIMIQIKRATRITDALKEFSVHKPDNISAVNIHNLFDKIVDLMQHDFQLANIAIEKKYDARLPAIKFDEDKLAQVFLNVLNNARDEMQKGKNNKLTIQTKNLQDSVEIRLTDTGPGIPEDVIAKIFDPFFTTKAPGQGTGLGLSISYAIIEEAGGIFEVKSQPGEGATFIINLPLT